MTEIDALGVAREKALEHLCAVTERDEEWVNKSSYCTGFQHGALWGAQWALDRLPSRDEIADAMIAVNPDYEAFLVTETERDVYLRDADAVLALIKESLES